MANQWLRLWHDMPNDPKWRTIARVSRQSIPSVMAVYLHLLVNASNATERGRTQNVCSEDIASSLDLECEQVDAIITAMQGRVLDGDLVSGWSKRQVDRDDGAAERAKAWRQAKKQAKNTETERNQTQPNADRTQTERKQTPDKDKDKDKEEIPPIPPKGACPPKTAVSLPAWLTMKKAAGEQPIPPTDAVFAYAEQAGITEEMLRLAWREFRDRYSQPDAKRYKDWRAVFAKSVRGNWHRLWRIDAGGGYVLTTEGLQAQKVQKSKLGAEA